MIEPRLEPRWSGFRVLALNQHFLLANVNTHKHVYSHLQGWGINFYANSIILSPLLICHQLWTLLMCPPDTLLSSDFHDPQALGFSLPLWSLPFVCSTWVLFWDFLSSVIALTTPSALVTEDLRMPPDACLWGTFSPGGQVHIDKCPVGGHRHSSPTKTQPRATSALHSLLPLPDLLFRVSKLSSTQSYKALALHAPFTLCPNVLVFYCCYTELHKPSRLKQHRFILTSPDIHSGFHWAKIKLSTGLPSIYKLQRRIHFLAFPSSWRLLTFLGSWPLPPSTACHSILCISHLIVFSD